MWKRFIPLILILILFTGGAIQAQSDGVHPHLWIRADDLPRLRSWATEDNPLYRDGIEAAAKQAVADMDSGIVPAQDTGSQSYEEYPSESYALLFAFMSLIAPDETARQDYAQRARTVLMHVMNEAVKGVADDQPFRQSDFSTNDRSRWYGAGFGLTVDWIYPILSAEDKATIRMVFLRWCDEDMNATTTSNNHPEPVGLVNDPQLISDPALVRWAGNNYYNAHMRNMGLMALSFDSADDPDGALHKYVTDATGAWLYVVDHLLRTDAAGGFGTEGFEYSPQSLGYAAQLLLALQTAGITDTATWGQQVDMDSNPFWKDSISAYINSLAPVPAQNPDYGQVYLPAWYGSGQNYWTADYIELFGPIGIHAAAQNDSQTLNALRWIEANTPPGGADGLPDRVREADSWHKAILYFLLYDPSVTNFTDPRPNYPTAWYAPGMRRLLARTDWSENASFFTYNLSWDTVDHQSGNGNAIEFYRKGEWLTKIRVGYDLDYQTSDNLNTLTVANKLPPEDDYRQMIGQRGSQWLYQAGDPPQPLISINDAYVYAYGNATNLYNTQNEGLTDVQQVSRSVVWLKPDVIVVYDRAKTAADKPQIRFWLNFPENALANGSVTTMTTSSGQILYVDTVLPANARISVSPLTDEASGSPANGEPMHYRLMVEPPQDVGETRFLHVLQGADAGTVQMPVTSIESSDGTAYQGVGVADTAVIFPVNADETVQSLTYITNAHRQIITGLTPNAGYNLTFEAQGDSIQVALSSGNSYTADSGGVLFVNSTLQ